MHAFALQFRKPRHECIVSFLPERLVEGMVALDIVQYRIPSLPERVRQCLLQGCNLVTPRSVFFVVIVFLENRTICNHLKPFAPFRFSAQFCKVTAKCIGVLIVT